MSEWKFLTADEIVKWYGERCGVTEPGCPTCAAWTRHDFLRQMEYDDIRNRGELIEIDANADGWCCLNEAQDYALNGIMNTEENERIDAEVNERLSYYSPEFLRPSILDEHEYVPATRYQEFKDAQKLFARLILERKIGDQDPDPYAGSEWAGGQEGV